MRFNRRRSARPEPAGVRLGLGLETLEGRTLLTGGIPSLFSVYTPKDLSVYNPITNQAVPYSVQNQLLNHPGTQNSLLSNAGKVVSGKDYQGDEWTITVHGPGYAIVTTTAPNSGFLSGTINTIQLVGTNINSTYVTGNVVASFRVLDTGIVNFNNLIDTSGVRSVILNGFSLAQTVTPASGSPNNTTTGIELLGGVRYLSFHDIVAPIDTSTNDVPINVIIGDPTTPLTVQPTIHLDSIFNTVFDSTSSTIPTSTPITTPTVNLIVNGQIKDLSFISTSQDTLASASDNYLFPVVGTTGRTSVQATGIGSLNVAGAATNFTASRSPIAFGSPTQNGFTGLSRLGSAHFHGPTDAVGLDVTTGTIGSLQFDKGLGNPTGTFVGASTSGALLPATSYGIPANLTSYAGAGYVDGQVTARKIGRLTVKPANVVLQSPTNPDYGELQTSQYQYAIPRQGTALTNALIVSSGNIGKTTITGSSLNSEIKSGFHYPSFAAGLEGTRAASKIGPYSQTGDLYDSVVSATYRPYFGMYGNPASQVGPGTVRGRFKGTLYNLGGITPIDNVGAGIYAKTKVGGYLPPPVAPTTPLARDVQYGSLPVATTSTRHTRVR